MYGRSPVSKDNARQDGRIDRRGMGDLVSILEYFTVVLSPKYRSPYVQHGSRQRKIIAFVLLASSMRRTVRIHVQRRRRGG